MSTRLRYEITLDDRIVFSEYLLAHSPEYAENRALKREALFVVPVTLALILKTARPETFIPLFFVLSMTLLFGIVQWVIRL